MPQIRLRLATAEEIRGWSSGEVTRPDLLDGATGRPVPGGLACEVIFGPTEDHTCRCGRRQVPPPPSTATSCPACGVPNLPRRARRDRFGHIELAAPVPHPWYLRRGSPVLAPLLGLPTATVRDILAGSVAVVTALDRPTVKRLEARERAARDEELAAIEAEIAALGQGPSGGATTRRAPDDLRREADALVATAAARRETLARLRVGGLLAREEARTLGTALGAGLAVATGGAGLAVLLDRLDLARLEGCLRAALGDLDRAASAPISGGSPGDSVAEGARDPARGRVARLRRRLRAVVLLRRGESPPTALLLRALPVLPPDLRPIIDAGSRLIASDLNALYVGVLAQNARLRRLRAAGAPAVILAHAERGLQRAVWALLDNARQPRPATPSPAGGGARRRPLADLSARLGGKAGRFRGHLLGKRVDYSGRAVIVPGPTLALDECGLPWDLALELFAPFVVRELLAARAVPTPRAARRALARREAVVWAALARAVAGRLVLLNRAPTLHRLSLRAFRPVLVAGGAIRVHPLVTKGFNADFDGDQMSVHLPLSRAAQDEARRLMLPSRGLRAPANGGTTLVPQQEIVLGLHYLTLATPGSRGEGHRYWRPEDALVALDHGATAAGARCRVLLPADWGGDGRTWTATTVGRLVFNAALPPALRFRDGAQGDGSLRALLADCQARLGDAATVALAEGLTALGYAWATRGGLSIGVGDAPVPPERGAVIAAARREEAAARADEARGLLTREESREALAATWDGARRALAGAIRRDLDPQNPLAMAIDSGARGKLAQLVQLAGLRGLVRDVAGRTIPFAIAASYREGLSALEYVVACRGARKGFADRSLNTAPAGYLTRRLVLAAQDAVILEEDCGTTGGQPVALPGAGATDEEAAPARASLLGRTLAAPVAGGVRAGAVLTAAAVARLLAGAPGGVALARSPLTCTAGRGVCRRCYGADPATGALVAAGAAVGIVAAQAIGEPGTQLTMTTFHLGGVALGGDITGGLPRVEELLEARRPRGRAPLAPLAGQVALRVADGATIVAIRDPESGACREVALPPGQSALVADGRAVAAGEPLAAGPLDPRELARLGGILAAQRYLIDATREVYRREGVAIDDRHLEVIARQLARLVRVTEPGDSGLLPGELVDRAAFLDAAGATLAQGGDPPLATPELVGLAEATRLQPSFLAAAAFERATAALAEAALAGREDDLTATNARVLLGMVSSPGGDRTRGAAGDGRERCPARPAGQRGR